MAFSEKEISAGKTIVTPFGPVPDFDYPITPKENWKRMMEHTNPLWIPTYWDFTLFIPKIHPDNVTRGFVYEAETVTPDQFGGKDMFGVDWEWIEQVGGSMVRPGKPMIEDMNDWRKILTFPNLDEWDWEACVERNKTYNDPTRTKVMWHFNGYFERLISLMEFEGAIMALVDEDQQDAVHDFFNELTNFYIDLFTRYKKYFDVDMIYFHDDWGSQRAPFFSPDVAREMLAPYIKRVIDFLHSIGVYFEFHCCGKNEKLVPVMIEMGVDVWSGQPLNDKKWLYDNYGDQIIFGVETPCAPDATDEECLAAAKRDIELYGKEFPKKAVYFNELFDAPAHRKYQYMLSRQELDK